MHRYSSERSPNPIEGVPKMHSHGARPLLRACYERINQTQHHVAFTAQWSVSSVIEKARRRRAPRRYTFRAARSARFLGNPIKTFAIIKGTGRRALSHSERPNQQASSPGKYGERLSHGIRYPADAFLRACIVSEASDDRSTKTP